MPEYKGTVLYVGGFELPDRNPAAHRVLNNAKIFKELGYKVVFCGIDKEIDCIPESAELISGFESYPIPYPKSAMQWIKQMLSVSYYDRLISKYDDIKFIVGYNLHAIPLARLLKIAKKKGLKVVADCTEWYENKFSLNPIKLVKCVDTFLCMRHFQKKCDGMIAISSFLADYYKKHIKNTIVLPPLVDLEDEKYINNKNENETPILVYSGSPSASKEALGDVVKVLNKLDDLAFKLKVVGVTREGFKEIYNVEPDDEKIEFLGRVSHKEALEAVKSGDYSLIIRPISRVTMAGFPTKFAEAISCGTAVIANDISDLAEYLKNNKNGYLIKLKNIEQELMEILSKKEIPLVEKEIFDYHNYILKIKEFLCDIGIMVNGSRS